MKNISSSLAFFIDLSRIDAEMTRRFDGRLRGIGFSDFLILLNLSTAKDGKMRRVDLADKMGLTASGITRLLAPMEKIGLIRREVNAQDMRVSYVVLAAGGKRMLEETMEDAEDIAASSVPEKSSKKLQEFSAFLSEIR